MALLHDIAAPKSSPDVIRLKTRAKQALNLASIIVEDFQPITDSDNPSLARKLKTLSVGESAAASPRSESASHDMSQDGSTKTASAGSPTSAASIAKTHTQHVSSHSQAVSSGARVALPRQRHSSTSVLAHDARSASQQSDTSVTSSSTRSQPPSPYQHSARPRTQTSVSHLVLPPHADPTATMTAAQHRELVMARALKQNVALQQRYQARVAHVTDARQRSALAQQILRQQHEHAMQAYTEIERFTATLEQRRTRLAQVNQFSAETEGLETELRESILNYDAGPGMLILTHLEQLKFDPTNVDACLHLIGTIFDQPQHPIAQLIQHYQVKVYNSFVERQKQLQPDDHQDKDVLQDLLNASQAIADVVYRAYPSLRLPLQPVETAQPKPGRMSFARTRAASDPAALARAKEDQDELEARRETVEEALLATIEDKLFTDRVWGMLRKSCSESVLTSEAVFKSTSEHYAQQPELGLEQIPAEFHDEGIPDPAARLRALNEQLFAGHITTLAQLPMEKGPNFKLLRLEALSDQISQDASAYLTAIKGKPEGVGADILVELLSHVVKCSGRFALLYELKAMETFLSPSACNGKLGYTLVTWSVVVNVIANPPDDIAQEPDALSNE
eukprot:TRINITY_DN10365_c0_g2_i1.p1 TRINITY_DN10365_c0_g2~~TRINITY_DN10365_c0_g2_i1.p1  ORF type:complete len:637 (+),score=149.69 TRINITY_DN10365_c0_g2_i1:49-1911(+)